MPPREGPYTGPRMERLSRTLVVLTLNEIDGVRHLDPTLPFSCADETLVIDGGSTDGTVEFFTERGVPVVRQEVRGRGEAFRLAGEQATGEALVFFSPDGNEDPSDIPGLFDLLDQGYDLAIASRFLPGARNDEDGKRLPTRKWANQLFTLAVRLLWRTEISDTINGFRAIRRQRLLELRTDASGFAIEYQISIRAAKRGFRIAEIPTIEGDRIGGRSTAGSLPTGLAVLRVLWRELARGRS